MRLVKILEKIYIIYYILIKQHCVVSVGIASDFTDHCALTALNIKLNSSSNVVNKVFDRRKTEMECLSVVRTAVTVI